MNQKRFLLIAGLVVIILGVMGLVHVLGNKNTDVASPDLRENQSTQTTQRYDNSGAGSTEENSPIQDHMQHALQHLGL